MLSKSLEARQWLMPRRNERTCSCRDARSGGPMNILQSNLRTTASSRSSKRFVAAITTSSDWFSTFLWWNKYYHYQQKVYNAILQIVSSASACFYVFYSTAYWFRWIVLYLNATNEMILILKLTYSLLLERELQKNLREQPPGDCIILACTPSRSNTVEFSKACMVGK